MGRLAKENPFSVDGKRTSHFSLIKDRSYWFILLTHLQNITGNSAFFYMNPLLCINFAAQLPQHHWKRNGAFLNEWQFPVQIQEPEAEVRFLLEWNTSILALTTLPTWQYAAASQRNPFCLKLPEVAMEGGQQQNLGSCHVWDLFYVIYWNEFYLTTSTFLICTKNVLECPILN